MSAHAGAWKRPELVSEFLHQRATVLPLLDVQEDLVKRLFTRHAHPIARFLDLGAGDGAATRLLLDVAPRAQAVLVDYSPAMLEQARERLSGSAAAWQAVRADLSHPGWTEALPDGPYDAVVSSLAIHHLTSERKRALYGEVLDLLAPGAMFVNMDVVAISGPLHGLFDEQMVINATAAEHACHGRRSDAEIERDLLADDDDDRPDPLAEQLQWLRDAGFVQVDVHFKWAEGAIFGGERPAA